MIPYLEGLARRFPSRKMQTMMSGLVALLAGLSRKLSILQHLMNRLVNEQVPRNKKRKKLWDNPYSRIASVQKEIIIKAKK